MSVTTILLVAIPIALMAVLLYVGNGGKARPCRGLPHGVVGLESREARREPEARDEHSCADGHREGGRRGCC